MGFRLLGYHEAALAATPRAGIAAALQTAAGLENTAVHMYDSVQMLPSTVSGSSILALARLLSTARTHHVQHAAAFNAASVSAGARARSDGDPAMEAAMVSPGLASINGAADVLRLAEAVESALEATYASFCAQVDDARSLVALSAVAPVEAQHAAILLCLSALIDAGAPELLSIPPDTMSLPAAMGTVGIAASFMTLAAARRLGEERS